MTDTEIQKFDSEQFDNKVCVIINDIHTITRMNGLKRSYEKWKNEKLYHLDQMYLLVDMNEVDFDDFCYYIFTNTY